MVAKRISLCYTAAPPPPRPLSLILLKGGAAVQRLRESEFLTNSILGLLSTKKSWCSSRHEGRSLWWLELALIDPCWKRYTHVWSDLSLKLESFIIYFTEQKLVPSQGTYLLLILSFPENYSIICHPLDKKYSRSFICWRFFTFNFECSITATHFTKDLNNDVSGVIQSTCIVMDFVMINQFIACNLKLDKSIDSTTWLKLFEEQGMLPVCFQKFVESRNSWCINRHLLNICIYNYYLYFSVASIRCLS